MKKITEKDVKDALQYFKYQRANHVLIRNECYDIVIGLMELWLKRHKEVKRKIKRMNMKNGIKLLKD